MKHKLFHRYLLITLIVLSGAGLLILAALGQYSRPQNDDFLYLAANSPTSHSNFDWHSNGRLMSLMSYFLVYPLPHALQIMPALTLLLFVASLAIFFVGLLKWQSEKITTDEILIAIAGASCIALASCLMLPSLYASFYWFAAVPPHTWSFCLVIGYAGLVLYRLQAKDAWPLYLDILLFLLLPFLASTLYEAAAALLVVISCFAIAKHHHGKPMQKLKISGLSLFGSLTGLAYLFLSPGALRRQNLTVTTHHDTMITRIVHLPSVIAHNFFDTLPRYLQHPELLLVMFLFGLLIGLWLLPRRRNIYDTAKHATFIIIAGLFFVMSDMCVVWVGLQETQTVREYFSLIVGLSLISLLIGIVVGQFLGNIKLPLTVKVIKITAVVCLTSLVIANLAYIPALVRFRSGIVGYANLWDTRDTQLRHQVTNGSCHIQTYGLVINGLWHMQKRQSYWVNSGVSDYYGVAQNGKTCRIYANQYLYPFSRDQPYENTPG